MQWPQGTPLPPLSPPTPEKPSPLAPKLPKRSDPAARFMSPLPSVSPKSKVKRPAKWRCELKSFGVWSREARRRPALASAATQGRKDAGGGRLVDLEDSGWKRRTRQKRAPRPPGVRVQAQHLRNSHLGTCQAAGRHTSQLRLGHKPLSRHSPAGLRWPLDAFTQREDAKGSQGHGTVNTSPGSGDIILRG